jgi:hypothetical protein
MFTVMQLRRLDTRKQITGYAMYWLGKRSKTDYKVAGQSPYDLYQIAVNVGNSYDKDTIDRIIENDDLDPEVLQRVNERLI